MQFIDYAIVAIYLAAIVGLGFFLQRKASQGIEAYFLGDRNLPWWALGASGMASNTDIAGTMWITALIYALGTKGFFIEIRGGVVLVMVFFMVFVGKWTRRSQVMTLAEWMKLRFGDGREGNTARLISAIANLAFAVGAMSYFSLGGGKFLGELLGIADRRAAIFMITLAMIYTAVSGFYGVIWTDVFQGVLIFGAIIYVCILAMQTVNLPDQFTVSLPLSDGGFQEFTNNLSEWSSIFPSLNLDLPQEFDYSSFNLFGIIIFFYLLKTCLEGASGVGGYMSQRYFAAKSDREAGLLSLFWILLLSFRWPLVTSFAMLGIHYGLNNQVITDPELILPTVLENYIPTGIRGLLVACFLAAAMSTFDSIINSAASYWVRDIYQTYINPNAQQPTLIRQSQIASIVIVLIGLLFSFYQTSINEIWGWLTTGLGAGLFMPLLLRWYWWRFNGYGFALGTITGMTVAIGYKLLDISLSEYAVFLVPSLCSLMGCIVGTLVTAPTEPEVLENFYRTTRPFGAWQHIAAKLPERSQLAITQENRRDLISIVIAVPWQLSLFLMGMLLVMKQWQSFLLVFAIFALLSVCLYFTWYRFLSEKPKSSQLEAQPESND
ncbi:Na+/solute symporter [Thalassoporum mexicanum PCC 7367]|uniref:sodium:solute symporter family transporter n=1 Tax=Thalassoporum mexicanum TaxID=3457544 RepID=UPI00029F83FF|nr:Na+/solute symporter [Pseudanabaena sp. PCC 7367]AFY68794.1 Na+/solute symporter [Pseudanabaena sp. PCC 7367]